MPRKRKKISLSRRGMTPEAVARRERAIGLNPWGGYNHNSLGCEFFQMRSWRLAIVEFERAVEINPWQAHFKANLARAYIADGQIEKGEAAARAALERDPASAGAMFAMGLASEAGNDFGSAIIWYRRCLLSNPSIAIKRDAEENIAYVVERMGK